MCEQLLIFNKMSVIYTSLISGLKRPLYLKLRPKMLYHVATTLFEQSRVSFHGSGGCGKASLKSQC